MVRPAAVERTIVGFRLFRERGGELYSLTPSPLRRERWPATGIVDAACDRPAGGLVPHQAPAPGCGCGAYAVDSLATLRRARRSWGRQLPGWGSGGLVTAAVLLWSAPGRPVIVGELRGAPGYQYRAAHMRVLALADGRSARRVAERHGLAVVPEPGLELYAREHGTLLRPEPARRDLAVASARPTTPARTARARWLIEAVGRRVRPGAPRTWTIGIATVLTLAAAVHLSVFAIARALPVVWAVLRPPVRLVGWLLGFRQVWVLLGMAGFVLAQRTPFRVVTGLLVAVAGLVVLGPRLVGRMVFAGLTAVRPGRLHKGG